MLRLFNTGKSKKYKQQTISIQKLRNVTVFLLKFCCFLRKNGCKFASASPTQPAPA